jgi:hypothetical protein
MIQGVPLFQVFYEIPVQYLQWNLSTTNFQIPNFFNPLTNIVICSYLRNVFLCSRTEFILNVSMILWTFCSYPKNKYLYV